MSAPRKHVSIFLAFGDRRLEVLARGFEGIRSQAEAILGLHPQSYELHDSCGEVESSHTLDRVLACSKGFCVLNVREKPEWQKMRQMEQQIQQLIDKESSKADFSKALEETEKKILAQVDTVASDMKEQVKALQGQMQTIVPLLKSLSCEQMDVRAKLSKLEPAVKDTYRPRAESNGELEALASKVQAIEVEMNEQAITASAVTSHLESGIAASKMEMENLRAFATDELSSMRSKVEGLETDITEQSITNSSLNGHLECGLAVAQKELETLRLFTAEQLSDMHSKAEHLEVEVTEQAINTSSVTGHLECGLSAAKSELETIRHFTGDMNSKIESLEVEVNEQAITTSSVTGHLECGLLAAKTELKTLRSFTSDELSGMKHKMEALETEASEQAITASAVTGNLQSGLIAAKTEMANLRCFTADQIGCMQSKVESLELEVNEQSINTSAMNGHFECGLSAAQKELRSLRSFTADQLGSIQADVDFRSQLQAARVNSQEALAAVDMLKKELRRLADGQAKDSTQWSDGFSTHTLSAVPYSKKGLHQAMANAKQEDAPFAQHFQRLVTSRSVPQLPAVA
mmetsp:Transcript_96382/g.171314  ORF Transcript_96382/g.171314 Transcript_96382/m.171314 type:complete len:576 (+) Transcript_96382:85-1812(+)|eukprot:CAMPEP_0197654808 /NCGR_PEP_ID=MMETSP1338-20131121/39069_1 /TAXON_ID=43686 ORGANISM="Pelagodinium beii, Strain RCC1491" /NCGR_SAMPLE_ID=MMETSP1338 /ASSEMBLY_ACC=CAM_ASM_000754 /LENGTH=575 /DNA_ID=CAMNT_0043230321 /DNA_START=63 /DNA_END=1790 /DNA_ORIENTATION=+